VILDSDEYKFLSRTIPRKLTLLQATREVDPKKVSEKMVKIYTKMASKFSFPVDTIDVELTRHELKEISNLIKEHMIRTMGETIPEYKKRQSAEPDKSNFYQGYIDKEKAKVDALKSLLAKVEGEL
jgi:hypothetical protein